MNMRYGTSSVSVTQARQDASTIFLAKVFNWMAVGLGLTGITALFAVQTGLTLAIATSPLFFVLILGELGLVFLKWTQCQD